MTRRSNIRKTYKVGILCVIRTMPENAKAEAVPERWLESPQVEERSLWFKDEDSTYPRVLIQVNGALLSTEDAKEMRDQLNEILE